MLTENRDRLFGDETSISSSMVVVSAAIVAFAGSAPLLGPTLCAAFAGFYWPHFRDRCFSKAVVNAAIIGSSGLAGAIVFGALTSGTHRSLADSVVVLIPVVAVYWFVNTLLLAAALTLLRGAHFPQTVRLLLVSETPLLVFAVFGGLCGYSFLEHGHVIGVAALLLCILLADLFMVRPRPIVHAASRTVFVATHAFLPVLSVAIGVFAAQWDQWLAVAWLVVGVPLLTYLLALVRVRARISRWDRHLAIGVAVLEVPLVLSFGLAGAIAHWVGVEVGLFTAGGLAALLTLCARYFRRRELRARADDRRVAVAAERAVLEGRSLPTPV
ncbi:MAG: hypothetical protein FJW86_02600 [Actinobacteria bacterium]|nr:hypothetical protein [Actinomycetota bacterium]